MKVSEVITNMIDWTTGIDLVKKSKTPSSEYANTPHEMEQPVATIIAQGDDVNKPKNPSDIRSNSVSMYPNFQAKE
jgi:hypothetical protein